MSRKRIHELAREWDIDAKDIVAKLEALGIRNKRPQSSLTDNEVERVKPELCRRFIFMTGHEAEPRTDNFIRRSRAPMLWKPFPVTDLLPAAQTVRQKVRLARLLARSRSVTPA